MTIALHRPRPLPLNHSAYPCPTCAAPPLTTHARRCDQAAPQPHHRLPYPREARVFAGLLVGIPIGTALWTIGALIVWSLA